MNRTYTIIAIISLALVFIPPVLYLLGSLGKPLMSALMLAGTISWFAKGIIKQLRVKS